MFFSILAIIGKVLFTILKILLFLFIFAAVVICLILFVPVRYSASVTYNEKQMSMKGSLFWLMHAISLKAESDGKNSSYILKIFGIRVLPLKSGKRKEKKSRKNSRKKKSDAEKVSDDKTYHDVANDKIDMQKKQVPVLEKTVSDKKQDNNTKIADDKENDKKILPEKVEIKEKTEVPKRDNSKILSIIRKIPELFKKISGCLKRFKDTVKKMLSAVKEGSDKAKLVKEFVLCDESRNMVCFVRDNVLHLWKHIRPKYLYTDIIFGFDDPAFTGQILGALAAFCAMADFKPGLTPDFEKKIFECEIEIKGRIMFFILLKIAIRTVFSEEIRAFRKEYDDLREVL